MNNQFTPRVSDIIMYSKEEANRLENTFIGPEHLLLGLIREGEGKAIEILFNLHIDLKELKKEIENRLRPIEATKLNDEDINFNDDASKILKLCILEARQQKSETVDSEHILLAIMRQKSNQASLILNEHNVTYEKVLEMLTFQPETPKSGLGFDDEDEEEDGTLMGQPNDSAPGNNTQQQTRSAQQKKTANSTPILDNFGIDMTRAAEEGK